MPPCTVDDIDGVESLQHGNACNRDAGVLHAVCRNDHLAAFEAALFNTKSAMQGQAAVAMSAEAEATFLRSRDAETTAAKDAAVAEIGHLKQQLQEAQKERSQKAEREALARTIAKLPEKDEMQAKIAAMTVALEGLEARLEAANTTVARRRAQFTALLRCVRDLEEVLDEETAADTAEGGVATAGDLAPTQAVASSSSSSSSAGSAAATSGTSAASAPGSSAATGSELFDRQPAGSPRAVATGRDDDDDEELEEGEA